MPFLDRRLSRLRASDSWIRRSYKAVPEGGDRFRLSRPTATGASAKRPVPQAVVATPAAAPCHAATRAALPRAKRGARTLFAATRTGCVRCGEFAPHRVAARLVEYARGVEHHTPRCGFLVRFVERNALDE